MNNEIYLLVYNMQSVLNDDACNYLGLPIGSNFEFLRRAAEQMDDRGSGYDRTRDGKKIWVAPYKNEPNVTLEKRPEDYEFLTYSEFIKYPFDKLEDELI